MGVAACPLRPIALLASLNDEACRVLSQRCRWRRFATDEQIIDHRSPGTDVFFITAGRVEVVVHASTGRCICFEELKAGAWFGALSAIDGQPRSATVTAAVETSIAVLPASEFHKLLEDHPSVAKTFIADLTRIIRRSNERIVDLSVHGAPCRVLTDLHRRAQEARINETTAMLMPAPAHGDIAARASTTRETVARILGDLGRRGLVRKAPDTLYVTDMPQLARLIEELRGA